MMITTAMANVVATDPNDVAIVMSTVMAEVNEKKVG